MTDRVIKSIATLNNNIEILGPTTGIDKKDRSRVSILLKSKDRKTLNTAARAVLSKNNKHRDINIRFDIDPI